MLVTFVIVNIVEKTAYCILVKRACNCGGGMITKMTIHNMAKSSFLSKNGHLLFSQFLLFLFIFSFTVL